MGMLFSTRTFNSIWDEALEMAERARMLPYLLKSHNILRAPAGSAEPEIEEAELLSEAMAEHGVADGEEEDEDAEPADTEDG